MFLIPDLKQMEVDVSVHESMGPRVRVGMKAKVKVASVRARYSRSSRLGQPAADFELEGMGRKPEALLGTSAIRRDTPLCLALHVGHSRDRYRPRLECTGHSCRGHGGGGRSAVVLCHCGKCRGTACDQDSPRNPRPFGDHRGPPGGRASALALARHRRAHDWWNDSQYGPRNCDEAISIATHVGGIGELDSAVGRSISFRLWKSVDILSSCLSTLRADYHDLVAKLMRLTPPRYSFVWFVPIRRFGPRVRHRPLIRP